VYPLSCKSALLLEVAPNHPPRHSVAVAVAVVMVEIQTQFPRTCLFDVSDILLMRIKLLYTHLETFFIAAAVAKDGV